MALHERIVSMACGDIGLSKQLLDVDLPATNESTR